MGKVNKPITFLVSLLLFLIYSFHTCKLVAAVASLDTSTLPDDWKQACAIHAEFPPLRFDTLNTTQISVHHLSCVPSFGQHMSFSSLRNWTFDLSENDALAVSIRCANTNVTVSLPWPFKAHGLVYLKVDNCLILDYNSELTDFQYTHIPDTLLHLELQNSRIYTDFETFENNIIDMLDMHPDVECGSIVLEKFVFHGVEYSTEAFPPNITEERLDQMATRLSNKGRQLKHICDYKNLREWSERKNGRKSRLFFQLVVGNSLFPKLEILDISNCYLGEIYKELKLWRDHFPSMTLLNMSHNRITRFDFVGYGRKEDGVGTIDLSFNNITQITETDMKRMLLLKTAKVLLIGNPINCSCDKIHDLFAFVNGDRSVYREHAKYVNPKRYNYLRNLTCAFPPKLEGIQIEDLTNTDIECTIPGHPSTVSITLIATLAITVVVLATLLLATLRYRREVRILVYTRLHIVLPCQEGESDVDDDTKTHDVFVSYSHHDADWVLRTLRPRLEEGNGGIKSGDTAQVHRLSLCLHHRDFIPGEFIGDNIVKSVESSRHTLLLLSRNFIQSEWCLFEFRQALAQTILEKKGHMVVVILDDVTDHDMDDELRLCLNTFTYIRREDPLFWDRIVFSLMKKRDVNKAKKRSHSSVRHPEKATEAQEKA